MIKIVEVHGGIAMGGDALDHIARGHALAGGAEDDAAELVAGELVGGAGRRPGGDDGRRAGVFSRQRDP
jgi:hypothetical protein